MQIHPTFQELNTTFTEVKSMILEEEYLPLETWLCHLTAV